VVSLPGLALPRAAIGLLLPVRDTGAAAVEPGRAIVRARLGGGGEGQENEEDEAMEA
jgi:hypothetical protein